MAPIWRSAHHRVSHALEPEAAHRIEGGWRVGREGGRTLVRFVEGFRNEGGPDWPKQLAQR